MEIFEKLDKLTQDKTFQEAYQNVKTPEELVELYGKNGVAVPLGIAQEVLNAQSSEEELSMEKLDEVAGGGFWSFGLGEVFWGGGYLGARLAGWDKERSRRYASGCKKVGTLLGYAMDYATGT